MKVIEEFFEEFFPHLHPMLVHFPIALFVTALILEISAVLFRKENLHKSALTIFTIGTLMTPLVVQSGLWQAEDLHLDHPLLDQHRQFAYLTMWGSLIALTGVIVLKNTFAKYARIFFLASLLVIVGLVAMTADRGGDMVFEYGVGVER